MADISKIKTPDGTTYDIKDATARTNGVFKSDELQTTNPFASNSLRGPYISKIDNAFYAADKRWSVTATGTTWDAGVRALFDGDYEGGLSITNGNTAVISFDFSNESSGFFPGYPYGYILVSFYYAAIPKSVSGRVYCNYAAHGVGWHDITFSPVSDSGPLSMVYRSTHQGYYQISKLEITIVGDTSNSYGRTQVTEIEMHLDRPDPLKNPFLSKYAAETLYYSLTAPTFVGNLQGDVTGNAGSATKISRVAIVGSDDANSNGWYKWGDITMSGYGNYDAIFSVSSTYGIYKSGILRLNIRCDRTSVTVKTLGWLAREGFAVGDVIAVVNEMNVKLYINQQQTRYGRIKVSVIHEGNINGIDTQLNLINSTTQEASAPTATNVASDISVPNVAIATGTLAVANGGTGATSAADARTNLGTPPTNHASTATTYGTGSSTNYGHVKLSSSTNSTSAETGGIAATPSAVRAAYNLANGANTTANTALSGVNGTLIYDHTYSITNGVATFVPHVYLKGEEVTSNYAASCFTWKYRLSSTSSGTPSYINLTTDQTTKGCTVAITTLGYGGYVLGTFTPPAS